MAGHWGTEHKWPEPVPPPQVTAYDTDPNPIIGKLLDHRGNLMKQVRRGPERRPGFTQP